MYQDHDELPQWMRTMSKPALMETGQARILSAGKRSEAGIGTDVPAGDRRESAGNGLYPSPEGSNRFSKS